jgi:hypothetical protein
MLADGSTRRAPPSRQLKAAVYTQQMRSHDWIDRRSLALHEEVARKLEAASDLLDLARTNLARWLSTNSSEALLEWQHVLEHSTLPQVLQLLRSSSDRARRLRQSSPFAGVLTREERDAILRLYDPSRA